MSEEIQVLTFRKKTNPSPPEIGAVKMTVNPDGSLVLTDESGTTNPVGSGDMVAAEYNPNNLTGIVAAAAMVRGDPESSHGWYADPNTGALSSTNGKSLGTGAEPCGAVVSGQFVGAGNPIPVELEAGAGTGAGSLVVTGQTHGGKIQFLSGNAPAAGATVFTATYPTAFPNGSSVVLSPASNEATAKALVVTATASGFVAATPALGNLEAEVLYAWNFVVTGY